MGADYYSRIFATAPIDETEIEIEWDKQKYCPETGLLLTPKKTINKYYLWYSNNNKIIDCIQFKWGEYSSTYPEIFDNGTYFYEYINIEQNQKPKLCLCYLILETHQIDTQKIININSEFQKACSKLKKIKSTLKPILAHGIRLSC